MVNNQPAMQETCVRTLGLEDPWRSKWQPTSVFLPGEFHRQRSLAGCSPWGRKEPDMTERLSLTLREELRKGVINILNSLERRKIRHKFLVVEYIVFFLREAILLNLGAKKKKTINLYM